QAFQENGGIDAGRGGERTEPGASDTVADRAQGWPWRGKTDHEADRRANGRLFVSVLAVGAEIVVGRSPVDDARAQLSVGGAQNSKERDTCAAKSPALLQRTREGRDNRSSAWCDLVKYTTCRGAKIQAALRTC